MTLSSLLTKGVSGVSPLALGMPHMGFVSFLSCYVSVGFFVVSSLSLSVPNLGSGVDFLWSSKSPGPCVRSASSVVVASSLSDVTTITR